MNDDIAPTLTLVKTVVNDTGGTATATDWTLTAQTPDGPNLSGTSGSPEVTAQPVAANVPYTIGESGPDGYDWTTLECADYPDTTRAAPTLTLAPGDDVTCTLTNDDVIVPVTVDKADGAAEQAADGTWTIRYTVVVTNSSTTLPTSSVVCTISRRPLSMRVMSRRSSSRVRMRTPAFWIVLR